MLQILFKEFVILGIFIIKIIKFITALHFVKIGSRLLPFIGCEMLVDYVCTIR